MSIWKKITKWEQDLKKAPKMALIRTVTLFFTGSVILGAGISWGVDYYEAKAYGDIERDIRKVETSRMNSRLEELSKSRVGLVQK